MIAVPGGGATALTAAPSGTVTCGKVLPSIAVLPSVLPSFAALVSFFVLPSFGADCAGPIALAAGLKFASSRAADPGPLPAAVSRLVTPCAARTAGNESLESPAPSEAGCGATGTGRLRSGRDGGRKLGCGMALLSDRYLKINYRTAKGMPGGKHSRYRSRTEVAVTNPLPLTVRLPAVLLFDAFSGRRTATRIPGH